jgi:hypothetical protein
VQRIAPGGGVEQAGGRARHGLAVEQVVERAEHVAQPVVALDLVRRAAYSRRSDPVAQLGVGFFHQGPIEAGRQRVGHRSLERMGLVDDEQRPIRRREVVEMGEQEGVVRDKQAVSVEDLADRARVFGRRRLVRAVVAGLGLRQVTQIEPAPARSTPPLGEVIVEERLDVHRIDRVGLPLLDRAALGDQATGKVNG